MRWVGDPDWQQVTTAEVAMGVTTGASHLPCTAAAAAAQRGAEASTAGSVAAAGVGKPSARRAQRWRKWPTTERQRLQLQRPAAAASCPARSTGSMSAAACVPWWKPWPWRVGASASSVRRRGQHRRPEEKRRRCRAAATPAGRGHQLQCQSSPPAVNPLAVRARTGQSAGGSASYLANSRERSQP